MGFSGGTCQRRRGDLYAPALEREEKDLLSRSGQLGADVVSSVEVAHGASGDVMLYRVQTIEPCQPAFTLSLQKCY